MKVRVTVSNVFWSDTADKNAIWLDTADKSEIWLAKAAWMTEGFQLLITRKGLELFEVKRESPE